MSKQLESYYKRKQELISILGGKCITCNSKEKLEFDHIIKGNKSFTITNSLSIAKSRIIEELKKCQLLCHTCHLLKNKIDNGYAKHGSISMYRHYRCRCTQCKEVWNKKCKEWKSKKI